MDPVECLKQLFQAIDDGNIEEAQEHLDSLMAWSGKGGFDPGVREALTLYSMSIAS